MSNEKITQILDTYQKYLKKVKKTFVSDERITHLLSEITKEVNQLHIEREKQELTVFKIAYEEGYNAALKDIERRAKC